MSGVQLLSSINSVGSSINHKSAGFVLDATHGRFTATTFSQSQSCFNGNDQCTSPVSSFFSLRIQMRELTRAMNNAGDEL